MHSHLPSILRNHIKIFQFFGFFNISLNTCPKRRILIEHILMAWSLWAFISFSALTLFTFTSNEEFLFAGDKFGYFNDVLKVSFSTLAVTTIYLEALWWRRRETLRSFWKLYTSLHSDASTPIIVQRWYLHWRHNIRFLSIFYGFVLFEMAVELNFLFSLSQNISRHVVLFWSMFTPYTFATHFRNMQFIFHMEIIRLELMSLQLDLSLLVEYSRFGTTRVSAYRGFEEFLRRKLVEKQRVYQRVYEMYENFQTTFGFSIITVLLMVYVRVLVDSYFMYYTNYRGCNQAENFLILPALFEIPALLLTSKNCMNVLKHITFQLHNIINEVNSEKLSIQIQNFSLQILHQKIRIDGVGIITMDGYMLTRAMGSVTMYMIFFIQFMPKFRHSPDS